jgi:hypothetical protein
MGILAVMGGMATTSLGVITQGKRRDGRETRASDSCALKKKTPRAGGLTGKSGRAGREMALPAKKIGQQGSATKYYLPVKIKAILFLCYITL